MSADPLAAMFEAVSFAARVHRHQVRKDGETPYAAHPFRVCLVIRHVFGIDSPQVLTAALLHDAIEDTPTDYDDLSERFGSEVAGWVAALTKDMRHPEGVREEEYCRVLVTSPWQVVVCKLADLYDNLADCHKLPHGKRQRVLRSTRMYMDAIRPSVPDEARAAFQVVDRHVAGAAVAKEDCGQHAS